MERIFFIDFDGTITEEDTCEKLVKTFCREGWQEINVRWERKEISTEECARQTFELMDLTQEDLYRFLDTIKLDPFFPGFVKLCTERKHRIYILSDGYDLSIEYLLKIHGLSNLRYFANNLLVKDHGCFIGCPNQNRECGQCGTCKRNLMRTLAQGNCETVYIGDGYSDTCVSEEADLVFAKKSLLNYCRSKNIPAVPYGTFQDIINWIEAENRC